MISLPQISVHEVAEKLNQRRTGGSQFILLDVREPLEYQQANLDGETECAPMSELSHRGPAALPDSILADKTVEIVVMCHHGIRSAQVSMWLLRQGWQTVFNLQGGINAYALEVDPLVGQY